MTTQTISEHVVLVHHPLANHSLTILRNKDTGHEEFRRHARVVSQIVFLEASKHVMTREKTVQTPLAPYTGRHLSHDMVLVPVLRAGLAMLFAVQDVYPSAKVGFVGLERDEETAVAREYYEKIPFVADAEEVFVLDPMLATGGSFDDTVEILKKKGAKKLTLVCIVAAPEGIERILRHNPEVCVYTAAIDDHLNEKKYIVPGLGDFGDRYFGTVLGS